MSALTSMYNLLLSLESDFDDGEIDIITTLSQKENFTKTNFFKKKKNARVIIPKRWIFVWKAQKLLQGEQKVLPTKILKFY